MAACLGRHAGLPYIRLLVATAASEEGLAAHRIGYLFPPLSLSSHTSAAGAVDGLTDALESVYPTIPPNIRGAWATYRKLETIFLLSISLGAAIMAASSMYVIAMLVFAG